MGHAPGAASPHHPTTTNPKISPRQASITHELCGRPLGLLQEEEKKNGDKERIGNGKA